MKILLLRFSSIGDIVLTSPVIRGLKLQTGAEIHFLTKQTFSAIPEANPYVDRTWTIGPGDIGEVLPDLKKEKFDYLIDLHKNLRTARVRLALGVRTFTFRKLNLEKWLLVNLKIDHLPNIHVVERYMETVKKLGVNYDAKGLDYFIPEEDQLGAEALAKNFPLEYKEQIEKGNFLAIVVGAAHATKQIPEDMLIQFGMACPKPMILLGGPGDKRRGAKIAEAVGTKVWNACGSLRLHQSASVIALSEQVVTPDTGLMHIAAALRKPVVSIWGNTTPRFGMYPFYPDGFSGENRYEVSALSCRPCSKIGYPECPRGHFKCMYEQDLEKMLNDLAPAADKA